MKKSSLIIAGSGIKFLSHLTHETKVYIEQADKVLYLVNEPAMQEWIQNANPNTESLDDLYVKYSLRSRCYEAIADYILDVLHTNINVCVVLYGHPTVFAQPALNAALRARQEGYLVKVLPGISAEDCLFADLLVNPGSRGCLSFEATDFLVYKRIADSRSHLILWQVGRIGRVDHLDMPEDSKGPLLLVEYLNQYYDLKHEVVLYEAALYPHLEPKIINLALGDFPITKCSRVSTLYIPPSNESVCDESTLKALGLSRPDLR